jgi:XRE family transcriptional regulator, regulator of sulfur utilization
MTLGERIAQLRKQKGFSQELLAEHCKVSLRTIQRIESNASAPRPYTLKTIADVLGISVSMLDEVTAEPAISNLGLSQLRFMNLLGAVGVIIPLLNILLPLQVWRRNAAVPMVKEVGTRIISFQTLWTLGTIVILVLTRTVAGALKAMTIGNLPPTVPFAYFILSSINIWFVLSASLKLGRGDSKIYSFVPKIF